MLKKIFLTVAVVNFLMLNLAVGYLVYLQIRSSVKPAVALNQLTPDNDDFELNMAISATPAPFVCDEICQKTIEEKVSEIVPSKSLTSPTLAASKIAKTRIVSYIPIPGAGNTTNTAWTNLPGTEFSFSKADYIGFKEAYFEANIKLFNGNGSGYVRLYDVTNNRAVDGSEIQTSSQTSQAVSSGKISLWEGNNTYRVQARSLTADTTYFETGRIKIINEQ